MHLHVEDIKKITEVLKKFPNVTMIELKQDTSSRIGFPTTLLFDTEINGIAGRFEVVITTIEDW